MLESSVFLKDDCLKINCTVGVVVSAVDCSRLHSIHVPESDIGAHFGMLLENKECSDVTFNVSGEKFYAHKLVLAARSPVFETEFFNGMDEDDQEIVITDMEPNVFKVAFPKKHFSPSFLFGYNAAWFELFWLLCQVEPTIYLYVFVIISCMFVEQALLHYIYRDTLVEDEDFLALSSSCMPSLSDTFAAKLLAAAEKYGLPRLRLMCESVLCRDISVDSVANILALADSYHASDLKSVCLKFAAENLVGMFFLLDFFFSLRFLIYVKLFRLCCYVLSKVQCYCSLWVS